MAQATFSIRMDEKLKKEFDALCNEFGMNATTAFNIFARTVVREKKIPFEISAVPNMTTLDEGRVAFERLRAYAEENGLQNYTEEEIDEEIRRIRG